LDPEAPGTVVVVVDEEDTGPVVDVVVAPSDVVVVEVDDVEADDVEVVVEGDVVVVVVVDVGGGRVVEGVSKILCTVVPPPEWPKISANGRPTMSSTTVTSPSAKTKTPTTAPTTIGQRRVRRGAASSTASAGPGEVRGVVSTAPSVSTTRSFGAALVAVSPAKGEEPPDVVSVTPAASVPPSRRSNFVLFGTRTATCLTALLVLSIDCRTSAVPVVAATDPMATPTTVPLTPKMEAMIAESTAPAAEARICRYENFMTLRFSGDARRGYVAESTSRRHAGASWAQSLCAPATGPR
jgi:hypothetical protein